MGGWREQMAYLEGGTRSFVACVEEKLREMKVNIFTDCDVQEIAVENNNVKEIKTKNEEISVDACVSTVPVPLLLKMMPELSRAFPDYHARLSKINYVGVMCCLLLTESPLTNNFWLNVVDKRIPFVVTVEYTNLAARKDLGGSLIYIPHYVPVTNPLYALTDEDFEKNYHAYLRYLKPDYEPSWLKKHFIFRSPYAQAVCTTGFLNIVPSHETPLENFYIIESTQLYPNDRTISGSLELSEKVAGYF
jgi:protoporphyrinogen oxidase